MLLISWNVAGWESTCKYIEQYYGTPAQFFERHGADIVALQEVKVQRARLADPKAARALGAHLDGWDSFGSFNTTSNMGEQPFEA